MRYKFSTDNGSKDATDLKVRKEGRSYFVAHVENKDELKAEIIDSSDHSIQFIKNDGSKVKASITERDGKYLVEVNGEQLIIEQLSLLPTVNKIEESEDSLESPMPGKVFEIFCSEGDEVKKGQKLLSIEAMKMEMPVRAPHPGRVKKICFPKNSNVKKGDILIDLEKL